jgi:hypothetical protein
MRARQQISDVADWLAVQLLFTLRQERRIPAVHMAITSSRGIDPVADDE